MRLLVYNIAYGTGAHDSRSENVLKSHRYIRTHERHFEKIVDYIKSLEVDIIGLVEIDTGSYRNDQLNQVKTLADHLNHFHICGVKYGEDSILRRMPYLKSQSNAILTACEKEWSKFHYMPRGVKKLVIESRINDVHFFLVHLALTKRVRQYQLDFLQTILPKDEPVIIAGDFNTMRGDRELHRFMDNCGLVSANAENIKTYPAWGAKKELDYILCSKHIAIKDFEVPEVNFSDHHPLIMDFELKDI